MKAASEERRRIGRARNAGRSSDPGTGESYFRTRGTRRDAGGRHITSVASRPTSDLLTRGIKVGTGGSARADRL